ncbi:MAG: hypothetical protein ABI083_18190 [Lapillicoccus sp.]
MQPVETLSVRELISALATLEEELRSAGEPGADGVVRRRWLEAREVTVLRELRRRTPDVTHPDPAVAHRVTPPGSAVQPFSGDPDAGGVGDAGEGEDLGEGLIRT